VYTVDLASSARRELHKLPSDGQRRVISRLERLAPNPRPHGATKLSGTTDTYRIRVGDYRVVYEVHDDRLLVMVIRIRRREHAYQD